jgi:adenylate cyclase
MQRGGGTANVLIDQISDWLMGEALGFAPIPQLVEGAIARVHAAGIPIFRFHTSFNVLHPLYHGMGITWRRDRPLEVATFAQTRDNPAPQWQLSPLKHMIDRRITSLRRRLTGAEALLDFPILGDLRDQGATDYYGFIVPFGPSDDGLIGSWVTDRAGGFSNAELASLMRIERRLAVACRMMIRGQVAENVVATYLGPSAGKRVLAGQIKRGDGETIPAVIWYSDLRGSTAMAERLGRDEYTHVLNSYFECIGGAVTGAGGEILSFIGDAVLAIFPLGPGADGAKTAAGRAYDAGQDAFRRLAATNEGRRSQAQPELAFGLALHIGDVMFGNIGIPERLSFSVIGSSVNQVARLEELTKTLGRNLLVSRPFADALPASWEPLGPQAVRGIPAPIEVFAPRRS